MYLLEVIIFGVLGIGGVIWQYNLLRKDWQTRKIPDRVIIPLILGAIAAIGIVIHALIAHYGDPRSTYDWQDMLANLKKIVVLFFSFSLKSFFGPIFTALALIMFCYFYLEYGEIRVWDFISIFFDWVFSKMPNWVENIYYCVLFLVAVGGSLSDGSSH